MNVTNLLKKKSIQTLCLATLLSFISLSAQAAEFVSVKSDNVNVRTGPNTNKPIYMELFRGYPLKVLSRKGDWLQISDYEKDNGWIHSSLVEQNSTVIVNAKNKVNLRSKPSTKSSIVASIERGVVLTKITSQGKWVKVKHSGGTQGWIYGPLTWP